MANLNTNQDSQLYLHLKNAFLFKRQPSSDAYRRAEQLVLYIRALHILSSALVFSQKQSLFNFYFNFLTINFLVNAEKLHPSPAVQNVLNQLNEKYHHVFFRFFIDLF